MNRKYRIPAALIMAALWIFLIYHFAGIYFETNDDRILSEIFSGSMTGSPEAHAYYVNYILGFLLSSLYRLTTSVPWYGGMLVLFQFLCCFFIADAFLSRCHGKKELFFALLLCAVLYTAEFYIIAGIQYTSTAAMLAITGYLCLLLYPGEKSRQTIFFLLEFLSYLLRSNAMLMIQPMGFAVLAGFYFAECELYHLHSFSVKEYLRKCRPLFQSAVLLLLILLIGRGSYHIFYSSPGWQEYEKINDAVTEITDYASIPPYEQVQEILPRYGVTQKQYNAFLQYAMIEENLSGDCLLEIAQASRSGKESPPLSLLLEQFSDSYTTRKYWDLNFLLLAAWAVCIICVVFAGAFSFLLPMAGLFLARSTLWLFLLYEGRIPPRVMVPLYLGEISYLLCLFFLTVKKEFGLCSSHPRIAASVSGKRYGAFLQKYLPFLLISLLLPFAAQTLKSQYLYIAEKNANEVVYFTGMQEIISYCNNHPENRYFIDASALIYYRGSAFETKIYGERNNVITGCWYSGAPVLYQYEKDYFSGCDTIYLITSSDMEMQASMVTDYLEELLNSRARPEETFMVSNGGKYLVYAFSL